MSSLDTTSHQLSSYDFRVPVLFLSTMSILQQVLKKASRQRPLPDQRAFSLSDSSIFLSLFVSPSGWQNAFFPTAALVLQYVLNQANRQRLLSGLKILRCHVVETPYVPEVIGTELKNNQAKRKHYDSSLVIVNRLTMIEVYKRKLCFRHHHRVWNSEQDLLQHLNAIEICYHTWSRTERSWHLLGRSSVRWFNPTAATCVESKKPTIDIRFTRPIVPTIHGLFLPVVQIKPTGDNESVQISIQIHWNRRHAMNSMAIPPTCIQKGRNLRFLLQSQKSG